MSEKLLNTFDYEVAAKNILPKMVHGYYAGGASDLITVQENREAYNRIQLSPRMLVDVSQRNLSTAILGQELTFPIIVAPMAIAQMAHPDGELAIARAVSRLGGGMTLSTLATTRIEEVAEAGKNALLWFQLYVYTDREVTRHLVKRAEDAGYQAIVLTVDVPVRGNREQDFRNDLKLPPEIHMVNLESFHKSKGFTLMKSATDFDPSLTWKDVEWLASITELPIFIKGILRPDDAVRCIEHGASGVIVSNHGGRQLDTTPATISVLPRIAKAVDNQLPILVDGGIRRGSDIFKALALGANAVLVGRPILWGLAVNGEEGVHHVLHILQDELDTTMALCGCPTIADINADFLYS